MTLPPEKPIPMAEPVVLSPSLSRRTADSMARRFAMLSTWKKVLLVLSVLLGIVGVVGTTIGYVRAKPPEQVQAQQTIESIRTDAVQGQNLTPDQQAKLEQARQQVAATSHWFYEKTAPHLAKIGFGFFVGFILGFMSRQFLKTMAILAAVVLVGGAVAAYLGYLDLSHLRENLTQSTGWLTDQLAGAKNLILSFIGASLSGTLGFIIGFTRR